MSDVDGRDGYVNQDATRIVIVGPCASGKSTLAANLKSLGFDARVSGQEHSEISSLWARVHPEVLIGLHIDLDTLRARRGESWSQSLFATQMDRLGEAYAAADLHLDTAQLDEHEVLTHVLVFLATARNS